jgi:predicted short-subunit dehydrogenase-like oxidoreductase (DUF2520 family)
MGQALGRLLRERGEPIAAVASRTPERAAEAAAFVGGGAKAFGYRELPQYAARILIAVPDEAIADVARVLAEAGMHRGTALHTCGARGPEALAPLAAMGVACGALHPLQTVANPEEGVRALPGVAFAIDGDGEAGVWAEHLVALLGGLALRISAEARPLYHAAAVMASNYVVTLISAAVILMKEAGVEESLALRALAPLARTSVENAADLGPAAALTGPIARGDAATVRAHLAALEGGPEPVESLYRIAGLATLELARRRDLPEARARAIEKLLRKGETHA